MPLTRTALGGDDESPRRRFKYFTNREASKICREMGVPVNILDILEEVAEQNGLNSEKFKRALEEGNPLAQEINERSLCNRAIATEGLLIQKSLEDLGRIQAEQDQYTIILEHNQALAKTNKECRELIELLEKRLKSYFFTLTPKQIKRSLPFVSIGALLVILILFTQNAHNTSSPNPSPNPSPIQPSK